MRHHRSNQRLFNIPSSQARLYGRETYALFTRGKDTPYVFDVLLGHRNVNNLRSRVFLFFFLSLSLSMWSQELDWNFDRERGTVKRRTVNYFIPVLGEEILHDIELERGKSIKRRNFARVRCQVTLAKRRVFFYEVNKENGRSQGYDIPIQRKEERREIFKRSVYYILYETLKWIYTRSHSRTRCISFHHFIPRSFRLLYFQEIFKGGREVKWIVDRNIIFFFFPNIR